MHTTVRRLAHELRLFGIHAACEARAHTALSDSQHPLEFLALLLEDERLARRDRLAKSLTTRAKFRHQADIQDWDQSFERGLTKAQIKELSVLSFYHNKENLIVCGRTGEGKTHLAIALGRRLCQEALSVAFLPVNRMFEEVLAARSQGKLIGYLNRMNQTQVLIFDDFGLRSYTHDEATILVELLEARARKGPVIVTSQVDPKGWLSLFEDPVIAEAIVDRLLHPARKIQLKGGSYRERLAALPRGNPVAKETTLN
jgi:DNA replication protein DnaC